MSSDLVVEKIKAMVRQVAEQQGCFLYDVEFNGRSLQVFIDKEGGAGIDDCSHVSRGLNELLEVDDPIPGGAYNLEVSTPGLERSLKEPWHFEKVQGKKAWMKLSQPLSSLGCQNPKVKSAKQLTEVLNKVSAEGVEVEIENELITIPFSQIEKAKLFFEFAEKGKKKN